MDPKNKTAKDPALKRNRIAYIATALIFFIWILCMTWITPFINDEWHFLFVWKDFDPTDNDVRVSSFAHIVESVKNYYNLSGGRALCHFFTFIFVNIDKRIFDLVNSLFFTALGFLIVHLIKYKADNKIVNNPFFLR